MTASKTSSEGKGCAVVTGAAGALGGAVIRELNGRGVDVALLDTPRGRERLDAFIGTVTGGAALRPYLSELATAEGWSGLVPRIEGDMGPIESATLVAGGWRGGADLHTEPDDSVWRAMMESNLETVHHALRAILPGMVARGRGSIVVIGSRNAERPWSGARAAAYTAAKAAVVALAQAVAAEVLEHGVRINAVLPSTLDTPANRRAMPNADATRWVGTDSAAKVIAFLLSDDARDVSGATLPIYGRS